MRKLFTILFFILFVCTVGAQDNCFPAYKLPVKNIQLSSGKLAYAEKGSGQTILFIHGLGGNISHWLKTVNELSSAYRCIVIDYRATDCLTNKLIQKGKTGCSFMLMQSLSS